MPSRHVWFVQLKPDILEVADLSLDEPELQAVTFGLADPLVDVVDDNETNETNEE